MPSSCEPISVVKLSSKSMSGDVKIPPAGGEDSTSSTNPDNVCKSPLLLERSETEFRRQVDVVYETKMIPRPTSGISGEFGF